jgi:hypothetical protein
LKQHAVQISSVGRESEVLSTDECLIIEVGAHVVGNGNDECAEVIGVALEVVVVFEHFKFDHVSVHAGGEGRSESERKSEIFVAQVNSS